MSEERRIRLYGTETAPEPFRILRAGPLEVRLENGNLRYIRFEGHEVLRAISYVVRDRDWGTLAATISDLVILEEPGKFEISYVSSYRNQGADLSVKAQITGTETGSLSFASSAVADGVFETNRCGFTVLHPINGVAGEPLEVEHCNGAVDRTRFPDLIDPWQPFKSIRSLTHAPAPHLKARCRMDGDEFEMEDQRNWSDASYKTYVRPLALPWPYVMDAGQEVNQSVTLEIEMSEIEGESVFPARHGNATGAVEIVAGEATKSHLPQIGLLISPEDTRSAIEHVGLLEEVNPAALLCHLDPTLSHGLKELENFRSLQDLFQASYDLEYVVACDGDLEAEFQNLASMVKRSGLELSSIAVCPSVDRRSTPPGSEWPECPPLSIIYAAARQAFPTTKLGGGMFSYFTELNRKRPPVSLLDFVNHSTNPIVHAADDDSVIETLETLPHITRSARALIGKDKEYRLGPSSIGMRQNPYGSRTFANPGKNRLCMTHDDPRQRGLFAAAWTMGYASAIAQADIYQWVPASFTGPRGIVDEANGSLWPVGEVVSTLAALSDAKVIKCDCVGADKIASLCVEKDGEVLKIASNLTDQELEIACDDPTTLGPFEVLRL
ncbi:D-apionate lactonase [Roseibium album]|uniref:Uncharacterized protein n=1 Tax=Roseibium album TaxID=311410 RepID=A0A0M7AY23_9HYPH|nr:hypothetical protein [Roseibium album]CTQ63368.1 hypothetical protein LA5094_06166 [Roseibium album]CTQ79412.1 hypothetical protein LA5096_06177 [Roseibium album]CTQ80955.1 hypothetical protein LA5095_06196 [Roseibium album]